MAISTPSGDVHGADEAAALVAALAPDEAAIERVECSSPDHAADLLIRLTGSGSRRLLLLGHLDTVVAHEEHRPLTRDGEQLMGSGAIDMKGGDVLALGAPARARHAHERLRRGRAAARVRRGVARRALRPRPALRGLRRLPVLRGRAAGRRRPRGRGRPPQGGRHAERDRARAQRALGLGARQGHQRAAGAGLGGPGGGAQPGSRRAPSASPPCRRCCTSATPSTSCPASASWSATCAPTASMPSRASCSALPPSSAARASRPGSCASGRGWTRARPRPRCCEPAADRARAAGHRGGPRRRQRCGPLRRHDPLHRRRSRAARRRRARAPRVRAGLVAAAPRGDRAGRRRRRAARLTDGRSERPFRRIPQGSHQTADLSARLPRSF